MMEIRRFPWGLTLACGLALIILLGLGTWQVQRMGWKRNLNAQAEAAALRPPRPLAEVLAEVTAEHSPEFSRVIVECPGLATAPYVELQSIHGGEAGVRLISLCQPERFGFAFLVDRGFIADPISARPPVAASDVPTRIEAQWRTPPPSSRFAPPPGNGRFYARDRAAMARALNAEVPVDEPTLFAITSSNPDWDALQPSAPPVAFSNNHLGYALTWYGLALTLVGFYIALLLRRTRSIS